MLDRRQFLASITLMPAVLLVLSGDMVAVDSYCGNLMEKADETFRKTRQLQHQLDYAHSLGLGEVDLAKVEVVEV